MRCSWARWLFKARPRRDSHRSSMGRRSTAGCLSTVRTQAEATSLRTTASFVPPDGGGNLLTRDEYANFVFRFEFKMEPGGNNGVGIRAPISGDIAYSGMEIQVLDDEHPRYKGKLQPGQRHGSIYDVVPAKTGFLKPAGEWNEEEITANGRHITVSLNGHVIVDSDLDTIKRSRGPEKAPRPSSFDRPYRVPRSRDARRVPQPAPQEASLTLVAVTPALRGSHSRAHQSGACRAR